MGVHTFSLDDDVAQNFKNKTPKQETSAVIEQLMRDYLDEAPEKEILFDLSKLRLSDSQQQLLELLIKKNVNGRPTNALFNLCKSRSIYGRSHHFGEGLKSIVQNDEIPYRREGDKIYADEIECSCGSSQSFAVVLKNNKECPSCDRKIIEV